MSFMITISLSIPSSILSALAPASVIDILEWRIRPFGTILIAAYFPVTACFAILTRPEKEGKFSSVLHRTEPSHCKNSPELPFPIVRPIRHWPIIFASSFPLSESLFLLPLDL